MKFIMKNENIRDENEPVQEETQAAAGNEPLVQETVAENPVVAQETANNENGERVIDDTVRTHRNLLFEDKKRRLRNAKVYAGNDGTMTAVYSNKSIHYQDPETGEMKSVDNSLADTGDGFETKANAFKTRFKKHSAKGEIFEVSKGNCKATLISRDAKEKGGCYLENCSCGGHSEAGEVLLKDVKDHVDIQYIVDSDRVKENIIIKERLDSYEFSFDMNIENMTVGMSGDEKTLELKDKTTGEVQFYIPGPFMTDADGKYSDAVYYEIETQDDSTLSLKVVADPKWINRKCRKFPITIDPQIVSNNTSLFDWKIYRHDNGSGSSGDWEEMESDYALVGKNGQTEYKSVLLIKGSLLDIGTHKVTRATLSVHATVGFSPTGGQTSNCYVNGKQTSFIYGYNDIDVTGDLLNAKNIQLEFTTIGTGYFGFDATGKYEYSYAPKLRIEYLQDFETPLAKESIPLAGGLSGELNLSTGEFVTEFTDTVVHSGALSLPISHIYKKTNKGAHCGENWQLNLHQRLERSVDAGYLGNNYDLCRDYDSYRVYDDQAEWYYTDEKGIKHGFNEIFYYELVPGQKTMVSKNEVSVSSEGKLFFTVNLQKYEVTRELVSDTGLKAVTRLDEITDAKYLEQRQQEEKQLEETVKQYDEYFKNLYVTNSSGVNQWSFDSNKKLTIDRHDSNYNISFLLLDIDTRLQLESMLAQINTYTEQNKENKFAYIDKQKEVLNKQVTQLRNQGRQNFEKVRSMYLEYLVKCEELKKLKAQLPVAYLIDSENVVSGFNRAGNLCAIFDSYENYIGIEYDEIATSDGAKTVIAGVISGEQKTAFQYNLAGQLKSIIDPQGRKTSYTYNGNNYLSKVRMTDGNEVSFLYSGNEITDINDVKGQMVSYLWYTLSSLLRITHYSLTTKITDGGAADSSYQMVSNIGVNYFGRSTKIDTDGAATEYYLDIFGGLKGKQSKYADGSTRERLAYSHLSHDKSWGYSVRETDDAVWTFGAKAATSSSLVATVGSLPAGQKEFILSAVATAQNQPNETSMQFKSLFKTVPLTKTPKYEIRANVVYPTKTETFIASLDYRTKDKQLVALPITIDRNASPTSISFYVEYSGHTGNATFDSFRFAPAEYEYFELNSYRNPTKKESGQVLINPDASGNTYSKSATVYTYDENNKPAEERVTTTVYKGAATLKTVNAVTKYSYNGEGRQVRAESYIDGEEKSTGVNVQETVYDKNGRGIKSFSYNTLDSSTKFYSEKEYAENGKVIADIDESGENKTSIEYAPGTNTVQTVTTPDGGKLSYGTDPHTDSITAITQSTEEGEANKNDTKYTCGLVTKLSSGNNTVNYEYDAKRRTTKVKLNGNDHMSYAYVDDTSVSLINASGVIVATTVDKVTTTLAAAALSQGGAAVTTTVETLTDKRGNTRQVFVNGSVQITNRYETDDRLKVSSDNVTGSTLTNNYDPVTKRLASAGKSAGANVAAVTETYGYNDYGQRSSRVVTGGVAHTYSYVYKNNAARDLDYMSLPNNLRSYPQTDVNGRSEGKILTNASNAAQFGEYIYYKKVGDHATSQISSIRYGGLKSGNYVIGEGLKYAYDKNGNIAEIRENGVLIAKYAYDKLNRIVREDNKKLNKSIFFTYDNNGNILTKREAAYNITAAVDGITSFTSEKLYGYDGTHGDRLVDFGGQAITYNGIGNPLNYRGNALIWEKGRQLKKFGSVEFMYDGYGKRTKKGNTVYTYDVGNKLVKQSDGTNTLEFIYDNSGLTGVKHGSINYIVRKNAQGDITTLLDTSGNIVVKYVYDAWGNHVVTDNNGTVISSSTHIGNLNPIRYRSYLYDTETKLYFLQTRYYDPEVGRFINADDVAYLEPGMVNGLNLYAYCGNNPVMMIDSTGTSILGLLGFILLTALIGGLVNGTMAVITADKQDNKWAAFVGGFTEGFFSAGFLAAGLAFGGIYGFALAFAGGYVGGLLGSAAEQQIAFGDVNWTIAHIRGGYSAMVNGFTYIGFSVSGIVPADITLFARFMTAFRPDISIIVISVGTSVFFTGQSLGFPTTQVLRRIFDDM